MRKREKWAACSFNKGGTAVIRPLQIAKGVFIYIGNKKTEVKTDARKSYNHNNIEGALYKKWEEAGYFKPEIHPECKPFTIVMPPPNITGQLHLGHAFDGTIQDILTRYKRMKGYSALWLPGEDHASIATEVKLVEKIKNDYGKTKKSLAERRFWKKPGSGVAIIASALQNNFESWALLAIGAENALQWTKVAVRL